jgi:hypothetical protein
MKQVSYEDITLAGATSWGVSAKICRGRQAKTIFLQKNPESIMGEVSKNKEKAPNLAISNSYSI